MSYRALNRGQIATSDKRGGICATILYAENSDHPRRVHLWSLRSPNGQLGQPAQYGHMRCLFYP